GYYCIDNLPVVLLPGFAEALESRRGGSTSRVAVGIDSRNREFLQSLPETLRELEELGLDYRIVFLESDEAVLIQRFSETRRKHPLTDA
ncbi:MAG: RNase adaptor protein RapZ, partial [Actinobacteria bacterium]|nr:RNase adaptor protein RapZ [Actinomycetota bacterium]NIS35197.1 RNase adaptor protein RapZ [Actinomycetota bacterium]NIU69914.1 RNase adaptor protein RapZ [Actinomycetota bacterium]